MEPMFASIRPEASKYELLARSFPLPNDEVLTLLTFTGGEMMKERESSWSYRLRERDDQ